MLFAPQPISATKKDEVEKGLLESQAPINSLFLIEKASLAFVVRELLFLSASFALEKFERSELSFDRRELSFER